MLIVPFLFATIDDSEKTIELFNVLFVRCFAFAPLFVIVQVRAVVTLKSIHCEPRYKAKVTFKENKIVGVEN